MSKVVFRTPYDEGYKSDAYGVHCPADPEFATKQSFKDECDVNTVVRRWLKSGEPPACVNGDPVYADVSTIGDYRSCLDFIRQADEQFLELPSEVRERFRNDPGEFLDFVHNPANIEEMCRMGLAVKREPSTGAASAVQDAGAAAPVGGSQAASQDVKGSPVGG